MQSRNFSVTQFEVFLTKLYGGIFLTLIILHGNVERSYLGILEEKAQIDVH